MIKTTSTVNLFLLILAGGLILHTLHAPHPFTQIAGAGARRRRGEVGPP